MDDCSPNSCQGCPVKLVCRCLRVTEAQVIRAITTNDLDTVNAIKRHTGAGDGCTCCHAKLQYYLAKYGAMSAVAG